MHGTPRRLQKRLEYPWKFTHEFEERKVRLLTVVSEPIARSGTSVSNPAWLSKRPYDEKSLPGCNITAPANAGVYKRIAPLVQMQPWLWRIPLLEIWSLKMVYALDWPDGGRRRQDYRNVVEGFRRMKSKQDLIRGVALTRLGRRKPD